MGFGTQGSSGGGGGGISGSGTTGRIMKFVGATSAGNSILFDNATSIGLGTATPDASSILDVSSTTLGLLAPRMTTVQKNAIASPATGLLVYDTSIGLFSYWDGSIWQNIDSNATSEWLLDGNTVGSEKWIGTIDNFSLPFRTNNVVRMTIDGVGNIGVGSATSSTVRLQVTGSGATDASFAFRAQNSSLETILSARNDKRVAVNNDQYLAMFSVVNTTPLLNAVYINTDQEYAAVNAANSFGATGVTYNSNNSDGIGYVANLTSSGTGFLCNPTGAGGTAFAGSASGSGGYGINFSATGAAAAAILAGSIDSNANAGAFRFASTSLAASYSGHVLKVQKSIAALNGFDQTGALIYIEDTSLATGHLIHAVSNSLDRFVLNHLGGLNMAYLPTSNAGLSTGDFYVDTAANILSNGDKVVGWKV